MKYIDEPRINDLLKRGPQDTGPILEKAVGLNRLSLEETAALLTVEDQEGLSRIFDAAAEVKNRIYGSRVVLFAPLYISNLCENACLYCAFKSDNNQVRRRALNIDEIKQETRWLLKHGHKRILVVAGESDVRGKAGIDYYIEAIRAIYSVAEGKNRIRRVNINCAPLEVEDFRRLKEAGIGTYQIFQETYHEATYRRVHPKGPKSDPDNRIDAINRAFKAGIDDVGVGPLYGLYDYRFETLALLMHIEALEKEFGIGPHTISVPRIEPALGSDFSRNPGYQLTDEEFKKAVAVLRLSVPYTGIILSTRELPGLRDELFSLGVSQASAGSRTSPGGYSLEREENGRGQFALSDQRTLDEVVGSLLDKGFIPSFCAACYRKERTGQAFMNLAKPGMIKGKCSINALVTLKEYLDDFASPGVRRKGYALINSMKQTIPEKEKEELERFFAGIDAGLRDAYV